MIIMIIITVTAHMIWYRGNTIVCFDVLGVQGKYHSILYCTLEFCANI